MRSLSEGNVNVRNCILTIKNLAYTLLKHRVNQIGVVKLFLCNSRMPNVSLQVRERLEVALKYFFLFIVR